MLCCGALTLQNVAQKRLKAIGRGTTVTVPDDKLASISQTSLNPLTGSWTDTGSSSDTGGWADTGGLADTGVHLLLI